MILRLAVLAGTFFVLFLIPGSANASDEDVTETAGPVVQIEETAGPVVQEVEETAGPVVQEVEETAGPVVQEVEETAGPLKETVESVPDDVEDAGRSLLPPTGGHGVEKPPSMNPVGIDLGARLSRTGGPQRSGSAGAARPRGAARTATWSLVAADVAHLTTDLDLPDGAQSKRRSAEHSVPAASLTSSPRPRGLGTGFGPVQAPLVVIVFLVLFWARISRPDWALAGAIVPSLARPG